MAAKENIILTGFSGTGKSAVGALAARTLGWEFVDTDAEIVKRAGKSVTKIFAQEGEVVFRRMEGEEVRRACGGTRRVIATGGGALMDEGNREVCFGSGLVVGLEASPETIYKRLSAQGGGRNPEERPMLASREPLKRIRELKAQRQPYYSMAHWTVSTDYLTEAQAAAEVARAWQTVGGRMMGGASSDSEVAAVVTHSTGSYPIVVGWGLLERLGERLLGIGIKGPVYIISDSNVFPLYGRQAQRSLQKAGIVAHAFVIPAGEENKSLAMAQNIYEWLASRRAERRHAILAVGGGVVGDLAGFVASTYLRGMPFVQVPTSMAAMVDASIGGKVAVNMPQAKNLVGAFYQPQMVLADPQALTTLGKRELAEGWCEAIKHGFILDAGLVDVFEEHAEALMALERDISTQVIRRSMAIKAQIVSEDERETLGRRILLNYGHTMGHALEATTSYGKYLHGEGVSVGMMGAARISHRMGMIGDDVINRQERLLRRFNLPTKVEAVDSEGLFKAMALDKKTEGGAIRWVLLEGVGRAVSRRDVPGEVVEEVVRGLGR
ncbi:MAG: 3-dehydroquinate synthase [SAR202 cluster bacterium]|nr:3-dehydroquinate synthase [SAR202 cluster bacterium]